MTEKKREGYAGEMNVLKGGFYGKGFRKGEIRDLAEAGNLEEEVRVLRVLSRRLLEAMAGCKDPAMLKEALGALGAAANQVGALMRLQKSLGQNSFNELIDQLIAEINEEWASERQGDATGQVNAPDCLPQG